MANTITADPNVIAQWSKKTVKEYVRKSGFEPYTSTKGEGIINVTTELKGEMKGTLVHCPMIPKLRGAANDGSTPLVGNEQAIVNYSTPVRTKQVRTAVNIPHNEQMKTQLDYANMAQPLLRNWLADQLRNDLITEFQAVPVAGTGGVNPEDLSVSIGAASADQKNAFMVANRKRLLVGRDDKYNATYATALATINGTDDKLSAKMIDSAVLKARLTTVDSDSKFAIEPYMLDNGDEWFVLFADAKSFLDLSRDPEIVDYNKHARPREADIKDNPLFSGTYLTYKGVVVRQVPEFLRITGAGASGIDVGYSAFCGKNAVNLAYNYMAEPTRKNEDDFGNHVGIGVREYRGQQKASVLGVQTGMVSIFHA